MKSVIGQPDNVEYQSRKPYQKPRIEHVKLVPEEAVLGGCKTNAYQINTLGTTNGCGLIGAAPCLADGS